MPRTRILMADDHTLLLEGYRRLLQEEFDVIGAATDGRELLEMAKASEPELVLMDLSMPKLNGIDATRRLASLLPNTKVLMVSMHDDPDYVVESLRAGAVGFVLKRAGWEELLEAIHKVLAGEIYVTPLIAGQAMELLRKSRQPGIEETLTLRQREVLQLVAEGRTAQEIAGTLKISVKTVEFHKARIMQQLGLHTVAGLTRYALRHGMLA